MSLLPTKTPLKFTAQFFSPDVPRKSLDGGCLKKSSPFAVSKIMDTFERKFFLKTITSHIASVGFALAVFSLVENAAKSIQPYVDFLTLDERFVLRVYRARQVPEVKQ